MRNTLIAAAVLGALAAPVMADGNVTLYGQVNVVGAYVDDGTTKTIKVDNAYTSSRLGFRGEEDLGDGLKAYFQIEQGIRPDDGTSGNFASREGWVGLQGSFGKLGLGRGKTPYTNMADWFDGFSDSGKGLPIYDNKLVGAAGVLDSRYNNTVRYDSPSMSGFGASVAYSAGENKDDSVTPAKKSSDGLSALLKYGSGPLNLGLAYGQQKNKGGVNDVDNSSWLVGGTYSIDALTFGLAFQAAEQDAAVDSKRNSWLGAVAYKFGATTLRGGVIVNDKIERGGSDVADSEFVRYSVGIKQALSKRTSLLAEFTGDDNKGATKDLNAFSVGVLHTF